MPVLIESLQQVAVLDLPVTAGTAFRLGVRLDGKHLYTWEKQKQSFKIIEQVNTQRITERNQNQDKQNSLHTFNALFKIMAIDK